MNRHLPKIKSIGLSFILCALWACADRTETLGLCESSSTECAEAQAASGGDTGSVGMSGDVDLGLVNPGDSSTTGQSTDLGVPVDSQPQSDSMVSLNENEVQLTTRLGDVVIRVNPELAPLSSANFLQYVDDGFYDGQDGGGATVFHRVISGFMIQGGGLLDTGERKQTREPIVNESMNGLQNLRGTVAMARTSDPNSATSQFFINHIDNAFLDYAPGNVGYAVFGEVVSGMETVDAIAAEPVGANDVPRTLIYIEQVRRGESQ